MFVADYVLMEYGTGAIMAVPAHDERDFAFAEAFGLPIRRVIENPDGDQELPYTGDGPMVSSGQFDGMHNRAAYEAIVEDYRAFAASIGITEFTPIPISGFKGDNITGTSPNTIWYTGPSLLQHLESVELDAEGGPVWGGGGGHGAVCSYEAVMGCRLPCCRGADDAGVKTGVVPS